MNIAAKPKAMKASLLGIEYLQLSQIACVGSPTKTAKQKQDFRKNSRHYVGRGDKG